jgi:signal transduction histidine kinase
MMIKKFTSSLSFRLFLLMAIVAVIFIYVLNSFSGWVGQTVNDNFQFNPTIAKYLLYVDQEVGAPPEIKLAEQFKDMGDVNLVISNLKTGHWPDNVDMQKFRQIPFKPDNINFLPEGYSFATYLDSANGVETYRLMTPHQTLYLSWNYSIASLPDFDNALLIVIGIILFTLLCCYLIIRYLTSPVSQISQNVQHFANGDMKQRINTKRKDELGELACHINNMEDLITSMLDAKRQLLLGISHELRTPLTRAKLSLAMLPVDQTSKDIERDLSEMEAQINNLLESERLNSKHQPLNLAPVSINKLVGEVIKTYFNDQSLTIELPDGDPYVLIDAMRVHLLIKNLLSNAVKYAPGNQIILKINLSKSDLYIKVIDHGPGISAEHLKQLTEPFYRPDNARTRSKGGVGLGLYLCRLVTESHGGQLIMESTIGVGSEFTAVLSLKP